MKACEMALVGILFLVIAHLLKDGILALLAVVAGMVFLLHALYKWMSCSGVSGVSA